MVIAILNCANRLKNSDLMAPKLPGHIFSVGRTKRYIVQDRAKWHPMEWKHKSIQDGRFVWNISWTAAQPTQFMDNLICDFFGHAIPTPRDHVYSVIRCPCRWTHKTSRNCILGGAAVLLRFVCHQRHLRRPRIRYCSKQMVNETENLITI